MKPYQHDFIELALKHNVLKFGQFELKSGRISPYFFNAGQFYTGNALNNLGEFYASALIDSGLKFDMLFGPAYKGIPLTSATACALARRGLDLPWSYNRKEAKAHGEGGTLVGAPVQGKVALIDDVITAGTAIREVLSIIKDNGAEISTVLVGLDRQERGKNHLSAIQELEQEHGIPVISIIKLQDIMEYLEEQGLGDALEKVEEYRQQYGISDT